MRRVYPRQRPAGKGLGTAWGVLSPTGPGPAHSIGNAVAAIVLAGAYLRATGDVEWLRRRPQPYEYGACPSSTAWAAYARGRSSPSSLYVSDRAYPPVATGTPGLLVWRALMDMADMAGHALGDGAVAEHWRAEATLHAAIVDRCAGPGPEGMQFYEGAFNRWFVRGRPRWRRKRPDAGVALRLHRGPRPPRTDPLPARLLRREPAVLAAPGRRACGTVRCARPDVPAYIHRLAGAQSEEDLGNDLSQLRTLADVDGLSGGGLRPFSPRHHTSPAASPNPAGRRAFCSAHGQRRASVFSRHALTRRLSVRPFCPGATTCRSSPGRRLPLTLSTR